VVPLHLLMPLLLKAAEKVERLLPLVVSLLQLLPLVVKVLLPHLLLVENQLPLPLHLLL
jgi:hypothetical protein